MSVKNKVINLTVTFVSIVISLFLLEFLLRCFIGPPVAFMTNTIPDPMLGHRCNPKLKEIDADGFRNNKVQKQADIVALGDSQTYGVNVKSADSWPQQLARMAYLNVYNFGVGDYGALQYKYLIDKAIELKPKYIILGLYITNDLEDIDKLLGLEYWNKIALDLADGDKQKAKKAAEKSKEGFYARLRHKLYRNSTLYSTIKNLRIKYKPAKKGKEIEIIYAGGTKKIKILRLKNQARATDISSKRDRKRYDLLKQILLEMKEKSDKAGVKFGIILIPSVENVFYDYLAEKKYNFPEVYLTEVNNERFLVKDVGEYLSKIGVPWVDVLPYVSRLVYQGYKIYPAYDAGHPLEIGYEAYAKAAYDLLKKADGLKMSGKQN